MTTRFITYCSFAIPDKCLGICILRGKLNPIEASIQAHSLGVNPGGQLLTIPCKETDNDVNPELFERMWNSADKLISVEESKILFDTASIKELDAEGECYEL